MKNYENDNEIRACIYTAIAESDRKNEKKRKFYNGSRWRKLSEMARARDGNIDMWEFYKTGRKIEGRVAHHIIPVKENSDFEYEITNLITVSHASHLEIETIYKNCPERKKEVQEVLYYIAKHNTMESLGPSNINKDMEAYMNHEEKAESYMDYGEGFEGFDIA